jgi:hypothetical protein
MQPVKKSGLEWARHLRSQLIERIHVLRAALADIEPLQQELTRLEAQLKGVDRLIAVQTELLGLPMAAVEAGPQNLGSPAPTPPEDAASLPPWLSPAHAPRRNLPAWLRLLYGEARRTMNRLPAAARQLYKACRHRLGVVLRKTSVFS